MDIYEPAEDSYLLQKEVQAHAEGRVLDLGTGSGIQGLAAIKSPRVREVLSVDINENAISELQKIIRQQKLRKIKVLKSNLFENITGKFNTIIFNPPYLPQDEGIEDAALYGGKKGWEVSEQFFHKASSHLIPNGNILFLFSTLTNKEKVEEIIGHHLFQFKELSSEKMYVNVPWTDNNTVYTHPTHPGDDINIDTTALEGATVISDLDFNETCPPCG